MAQCARIRLQPSISYIQGWRRKRAYVKKGGKLHIGGYSKPLLAFTDRNGVDGFVPSLVRLEIACDGFGLYVTGLEDDAVADWAEGRYDIMTRSRDEGGSELGITRSRGTDSYVNNL
jgi:hypothetical protein